MQEKRARSLGLEDPLEKEMATHSSILAWKNPMDRGAWQAAVHGVTKSWTQLSTHMQLQASSITWQEAIRTHHHSMMFLLPKSITWIQSWGNSSWGTFYKISDLWKNCRDHETQRNSGIIVLDWKKLKRHDNKCSVWSWIGSFVIKAALGQSEKFNWGLWIRWQSCISINVLILMILLGRSCLRKYSQVLVMMGVVLAIYSQMI